MFLTFLFCFYCLLTRSSAYICSIVDNYDNCKYSVVCVNHAGTAQNPSCDYEPYVTFIIRDSYSSDLTSTFFGSTNFDQRVRAIKANKNNWNTIEANAFKYYTKSKLIDISYNQIVNLKNDFIRNFYLLESLNVSHNLISEINPRAFFVADSSVTELKTVDMSFNLIKKLAGDFCTYVRGVETLDMSNNIISKISEDYFQSCHRLQNLNLSNNFIESINTSLVPLSALADLNFSHNKFKKLSGFEVNRLVSLRRVTFAHNEIEYIETNCFNQAFNLVELDVSNNKIKSPIENLMFINNVHLSVLDFCNNSITEIQDDSFKHNALTFFNVEANNLSGSLKEKTFAGLKNITTLDLSCQNLTEVKNNAFADMQQLEKLNLSTNHINLLENNSFYNSNITLLDLSRNNISNLNFLQYGLRRLEVLNLTFNQIEVVNTNTFKEQTNITRLDLSDNNIYLISSDSLPLANLQYLKLKGNCLNGTIHKNTFSPSRFLRTLDLSKFKIKRINNDAFMNLPLLAKFNISHNEIEMIEPNNFIDMNNLYSLDISHNKLISLQMNNSILGNIKALYLNNNKLKQFQNSFENLTNLVYLDLSNNDLSDISIVTFENMPNLKVLLLHHNRIVSFNNPGTNSLPLNMLNLSSNNIKFVNLSHFTEVVSVSVSNNSLDSVNSSILQGLDHLQYLDMSLNKITKIPPGTFQYAKILKSLNMSHNILNRLNYGSFNGLHRIELIDLSYNNLTDMEVDIFHECPSLNHLIVDYNKLKSIDIDGLVQILQNMISISVGGNKLSCKEVVRSISRMNFKLLLKQVEVTSLDKVYHEDNVKGITCDSTNKSNVTSTTSPIHVNANSDTGSNFTTIMCVLIIFVCVVCGVLAFLYKRGYIQFNRDSRRQELQSSLQLNSSDYQSDLLS